MSPEFISLCVLTGGFAYLLAAVAYVLEGQR